MLLRCYRPLHPLFENAIVDYVVDEDCNLDIFEMTTSTNDPTIKGVCQLGTFYFQEVSSGCKRYQIYFQWWENHEFMFPKIGFISHQNLDIINSQIEIKMIFPLARILSNFKRCLQSNNLDKLTFVNKNWPNDLRIGCKLFFNLMG